MLTDNDYEVASFKLACDVNAVKAVAEVESHGSGFVAPGVPKTLFEGVEFHNRTGGVYDKDYPTISFPHWTREFYGHTPQAELDRLHLACSLNPDAGFESASYGAFQIMGYHWKDLGYASITDFVTEMSKDDASHLDAFCRFILANPRIHKALQNKDWNTFALHYNGELQVSVYSKRMQDAYTEFSGG